MADKMLRIAGRGVDGKAKAVQTTNTGVLHVAKQKIEYTRYKFSGIDKAPILDKNVKQSERLLTNHLQNLEAFVIVESSVVPAPRIAVRAIGTVNNWLVHLSTFDWADTNDFMTAFFTNGGITGAGKQFATLRATVSSQAFMLTTHPNFYWLKDFKGNSLGFEVMALDDVPEGANLSVSIILAGEPL